MPDPHRHPTARRSHGQSGPTEKMRQYLEVIYYLSTRHERVIGARLAEWMDVTAPTVANIVQRMEDRGYITRNPKSEITLTEKGFALAEAMVKRHRVLECFLVNVLGVPWHNVHEEAVRLEHALSPVLEERIVALVSGSTTCPHGNPIPGCAIPVYAQVCLEQVAAGQRFTLHQIVEEAEEDSELLRYLQANGLIPGTRFEVLERSASYGITLRTDKQTITLSMQIAGLLWGRVEELKVK